MALDFTSITFTCQAHEQMVRLYNEGVAEWSGDEGLPADPIGEHAARALGEYCTGPLWFASGAIPHDTTLHPLGIEFNDDPWRVPEVAEFSSVGFTCIASKQGGISEGFALWLSPDGGTAALVYVDSLMFRDCWACWWLARKPA